MHWRDAVLEALRRFSSETGSRVIRRQPFISAHLDRIVATTESTGATPAQTLSRVLQDLRDEGTVEFLGRGRYLLLDIPINVEVEDLPPTALDVAIRAKKLRIGAVNTADEVGLARQRRGQTRLRDLTLTNYEFQCALCEIADTKLLVASHIVPWAQDPDSRGDLANVICLCRLHDPLFEYGYWSLSDELQIIKRTPTTGLLGLVLESTTRFRAPIEQPPEPRFLRWHRKHHGHE